MSNRPSTVRQEASMSWHQAANCQTEGSGLSKLLSLARDGQHCEPMLLAAAQVLETGPHWTSRLHTDPRDWLVFVKPVKESPGLMKAL